MKLSSFAAPSTNARLHRGNIERHEGRARRADPDEDVRSLVCVLGCRVNAGAVVRVFSVENALGVAVAAAAVVVAERYPWVLLDAKARRHHRRSRQGRQVWQLEAVMGTMQ